MSDIASVFSQANKPTIALQDPTDQLNRLLGTQGAMQRNRLAEAMFQTGQAYRDAIDPATGLLNQQQLGQGLANLPDSAASGIADALRTGGVIQGQQLTNADQQLKLDMQRRANINTVLGSLYSKPDLSPVDVFGAANDAVRGGLIPADRAQDLLQGLTPNTPQPVLRQWIGQHMMANLGAGEQLAAGTGSPVMVDAGGHLIPATRGGMLSSNPGAISPAGAPISKTIGPDAAGGQDGQVAPDGTPIATSHADRLRGQGLGALLPPGIRAGSSGGAFSNGGRYGAPGSPTAAGGEATAPTAPTSPLAPLGTTGAVQIGPPPGAAAAATATAQASAEQGVALQRSADESPNRQAMLGNMAADLQNFTSGTGADFEKQWKNFVSRYSPDLARSLGVNPQSIASQESFAKLAKQIALQQTAALGAGSDMKLSTSLGANPGVDLSKLGNTQIIGMLRGNEDAIQAKNRAWQTYQQQHGPASYGAFSTAFNQQFDPRVFQAMRLAPQDRANMLAGMSQAERDDFRQRFNTAVQQGWIADPRTASATSPVAPPRY